LFDGLKPAWGNSFLIFRSGVRAALPLLSFPIHPLSNIHVIYVAGAKDYVGGVRIEGSIVAGDETIAVLELLCSRGDYSPERVPRPEFDAAPNPL
jgi:hypothetical protein